MRKVIGSLMVVAFGLTLLAGQPEPKKAEEKKAGKGEKKPKDTETGWRTEFKVDKKDLVTVGRNAFFILEPDYQLVLEGGGVKIVVTVLNETKMVDGVETRVVEEYETKNGKVVEISRNYFAIDKNTNDVYYFGEDVDIYKKGKIVSHEGAWLSGKNGAKFGLYMPGKPAIGDKFYQEQAPGVGMDRLEVISLSETVKTKAGEFKNCLKVLETTPLEPNVRDTKYYAPGVGLIQEPGVKLVRHGKAESRDKGK